MANLTRAERAHRDKIRSETSWMSEALCAAEGQPRWFLQDDDSPALREAAEVAGLSVTQQLYEDSLRAKLVCSRCPVQQECLDWGLHEPTGIYGGYGIRSRQDMRKDAPGVIFRLVRGGATYVPNAPEKQRRIQSAIKLFMNGTPLRQACDSVGMTYDPVLSYLARTINDASIGYSHRARLIIDDGE